MSEKKSERLEVRLGYQEKSEFVEACDTQGDTPSSALRRFIRGYVRRADGDILSSAWRGAIARRGWRPIVFALTFAAIASGFMILAKHINSPSDDTIFAARDLNGDGELDPIELGLPTTKTGEPNGVMRVLDLDSSGTISRQEFVSTGHMVFALQNSNAGVIPTDNPAMTLVQFKFDVDETRSGTFETSVINSGELDRLVIWYSDGSNSLFEDDVEILMDGGFIINSNTATFPASVNIRQEDGQTKAIRESEE